MSDKQYTSNVESNRLITEEVTRTKGQPINPKQIWRDGALIPGAPSKCAFTAETNETCSGGTYLSALYTFNDGKKVNMLIERVKLLPLVRVKGTKNCFQDALLKNLIGREFDDTDTQVDDSWQYKLYNSSGKELAYGIGNPVVDVAAGTLTFRDEDYVNTFDFSKDPLFYASFYRYIGRTGFIGSHNENSLDDYSGIDLPFRDDILHFKDADSDTRTAQFVLDGNDKNTVYILPKASGGYHGPQSHNSDDSGVVMLEENYQDIDWNIGWHNGGEFHEDGTVTKD